MKAVLLFLFACESVPTVRIDGSSSVYPLAERAALAYAKEQPHVDLAVGISGSGGGLKKLCRGEIDIAQTSRRAFPGEACAATEVVLGDDEVVVIAHPSLAFVDRLDASELRRLWAYDSTVTHWNEVRVGWPEQRVRLYGSSPQSATFAFFTERVLGTAGASRDDYFGSEDDYTIAYGVAHDPSGLGFVGRQYVRADVRVIAVGVDLARKLYLYVRQDAPAHVSAFARFFSASLK